MNEDLFLPSTSKIHQSGSGDMAVTHMIETDGSSPQHNGHSPVLQPAIPDTSLIQRPLITASVQVRRAVPAA